MTSSDRWSSYVGEFLYRDDDPYSESGAAVTVSVYECPECHVLTRNLDEHRAATHPAPSAQPSSTDLVLPERAVTALALGNTDHAIRVAIAAELRRLVGPDGIDPSTTGCHREDADLLLARADELDPTRKD